MDDTHSSLGSQGCLWHVIHSGIKSEARPRQTCLKQTFLFCMLSPVVMQLSVSFGDQALEVVANTRGCHLLLLQLDLRLLARQAGKFLVLIACCILRVIREKSTVEQLLS